MDERTRELLVLIVGDMTFFISALYITLLVRYLELPDLQLVAQHLFPFLLMVCVWLLVFYVAGLYDKHTSFHKSLLFSRILYTQFINILLAGFIFLIVPLGITPKTNLVIYLFISVALVTVWRIYVFPYLSPKSKQRAILLADGPSAIELVDEVNNNNRYYYKFVRIIDKETAEKTKDFRLKLLSLLEQKKIDIIVVDPNNVYMEDVLKNLFQMSFLDFKVTFLDFHRVYEHTFDRISLSSLRYEWFITHVSQAKDVLYDITKRSIDILGSLLLGLIFLLILPFIALAMYVEDKGDIFIKQKRLGQYKKPIYVYKLRTMKENQINSQTWIGEDKDKGNTITKVGTFLRRTSLDEVPQVWNILRGDMSLIGPRNDTVGLAERISADIPYYDIRYFVKPGVTGWAQTNQYYGDGNISPQSIEETKMRFAYDVYYVKNKSLLLDIAIALKTIQTLMSRFGFSFAKLGDKKT